MKYGPIEIPCSLLHKSCKLCVLFVIKVKITWLSTVTLFMVHYTHVYLSITCRYINQAEASWNQSIPSGLYKKLRENVLVS